MGNCISKISKDRLFALEEFMKSKASFEKRGVRPGLDRLTGGTNTRDPFHKGALKKNRLLHYKLGCDGGTFFKCTTYGVP